MNRLAIPRTPQDVITSMKSEERHRLKENELGRVVQTTGSMLERYATAIVACVCVTLLVVAAALEFMPDLAFMDVGMPVLNGFDLATRMRAQAWPGGRRPRLVALTGWGQEDDRRRSEQAGFDEHLVKPAELETIERVCRHVAAELALRSAG